MIVVRILTGLGVLSVATGAALYLIMLEEARRQRAEDRRLARKKKEEDHGRNG